MCPGNLKLHVVQLQSMPDEKKDAACNMGMPGLVQVRLTAISELWLSAQSKEGHMMVQVCVAVAAIVQRTPAQLS